MPKTLDRFSASQNIILPPGYAEIFDLVNPGSGQTIPGLLNAYSLTRGATTAVESTDPSGNVLDGIDDFWLTSIPLGSTYSIMVAAMQTAAPGSLRVAVGTDNNSAYIGVRNTNLNVLATCTDGSQRSKDGFPISIGAPYIFGLTVASNDSIRAITHGGQLTAPTSVGTIAARTLTHIGRNGPGGTLYWGAGPIYMVIPWPGKALSADEAARAWRWVRAYLTQRGIR